MVIRRVIKDLRVTLKNLEGMVKGLEALQTGRELENFNLSPREMWANWLLCAVLQKNGMEKVSFSEGVEDDDGIIVDNETGIWIKTQHVSAIDVPKKELSLQGEARIIEAINLKIKKGTQYAKDKILIVFFDGLGKWYRNKVRESINGRHNFNGVYLIGLLDPISNKNGYVYSVTLLNENDSVTFRIQIDYDFTSYKVTKII